MLFAQVGCFFTQTGNMSEMVDYYSVIRILLRHGCELESILNLLLNTTHILDSGWLARSEEELDSEEEADSEEQLDSEEEADAEAEVVSEEQLDSEEEADAEAEVDVWAKPDPKTRLDIRNLLIQRYKVILKRPPNALLHWLSFLSDQDLDVNNIDDEGFTPLMNKIFAIAHPDPSTDLSQKATLVVLALCLLKADVSIRTPDSGMQALHMLFESSKNVLSTYVFMDLAYVLIRYGGADVHVTTTDGFSPLVYACSNGWQDEWYMVLRRCGFSWDEYITKERQCLGRFRYHHGNGDSTAIDTNDLSRNDSETVTKRKPFIGDSLGQ